MEVSQWSGFNLRRKPSVRFSIRRKSMHKKQCLLFVITSLSAFPAMTADLWINEFHYDDAGGDSGEFVEVVVPADFSDLASVSLTLYNGSDGRSYSTHALSTFDVGVTYDGFSVYSKAITGIQNGAPDGLALTWTGGAHFISYEGSFTAANGPAAGMVSVDIGVAQPDTGAPDGSSLGLTGHGARLEEFVWSALPTATPGLANVGQTVVPEPQTYLMMAAGALGLFAFCRSRSVRTTS